jgi:hypothetical protein
MNNYDVQHRQGIPTGIFHLQKKMYASLSAEIQLFLAVVLIDFCVLGEPFRIRKEKDAQKIGGFHQEAQEIV